MEKAYKDFQMETCIKAVTSMASLQVTDNIIGQMAVILKEIL